MHSGIRFIPFCPADSPDLMKRYRVYLNVCIQISDSFLSNSAAAENLNWWTDTSLMWQKLASFSSRCLCWKMQKRKGHCLLQGLSWIFEGRCKFHLLKEMLWSPISETFGIEPDCPLFATGRWIAFLEFFRHFHCIWTHLLLKYSLEFVNFLHYILNKHSIPRLFQK